MEIKSYLRAIRRWLWLPVLLPLVAAGATAFILERQPSQYQADATVVVPAVSAKGFSTSAASQYVATFKDVLVSEPVVNDVSKKTGVPVKELVAGLSADTVTTSSNIIHVTFLGTRGQNITHVVDLATTDALDAIAQPQLVEAQNALTAAQTQLDQANAAITSWQQTTGIILPQQQFNTQQSELNQLLLQLSQAKISNDTARQQALQQIIAQRESQLAVLANQVNQYSDLSDARQSALSVRDHAATELADAHALLAVDHAPGTVSLQDIGRVSKLADVAKFTGIAFAVALILALGLILLMELMHGRRAAALPRTSMGATSARPLAARPWAAGRPTFGAVNNGRNGHPVVEPGLPSREADAAQQRVS